MMQCLEKNIEKTLKKQYEEIKKTLEENNSYLALMKMIRLNDWKEFDISDEIGLKNNDRYCSFIGTKEEYENLLTSMDK